MQARLLSVERTEPAIWLAVFDLDGRPCTFQVERFVTDDETYLEVRTLTKAFIDDSDDEGTPINQLIEAVRDELFTSPLFAPIYAPDSIRDTDFDASVSGARAARNLFWVDTSLQGRELFEVLFAHAQAEASTLDLADHADVAHCAEHLLFIAGEMDVICLDDRPRRLVQAVESFALACQAAKSDDRGQHVTPEDQSELRLARSRLAEVDFL